MIQLLAAKVVQLPAYMTMEATLAESLQPETLSSTMPTVILLSGWTPGPMNYLRQKLQRDVACEIVEPQLRMPPWKGLWCADINFLTMCAATLLPLWGLWKAIFELDSHDGRRSIYILALFILFCGWIRLIVAVVVRSAVAHGVDLCLREMRRCNVVLLVGFSWGAGVLSELLTRDTGLDIQPAFLLIAPVSSTTAVAAMREDAALRVYPTNTEFLYIVHASDDPIFCPQPHRWERLSNVKTYILQDNHVFKQLASRRALAEIMVTLFRVKTGSMEP